MYTINDLWSGSVIPCEMKISHGDRYGELLREIIQQEEALFATLTEEEKQLYDKINSCQLNMTEIEADKAFAIGFRIGVGLMLDALER